MGKYVLQCHFSEVKILFLKTETLILHLCRSCLFAETKLLTPEIVLMNQST